MKVTQRRGRSDADVPIQFSNHRIADIRRRSEFGYPSHCAGGGGHALFNSSRLRLGFRFNLSAAIAVRLLGSLGDATLAVNSRSGDRDILVSGDGQFRADAAAVLARDPELVRAVAILRAVNNEMAAPLARFLRSGFLDRKRVSVKSALDYFAVGVSQRPVEFRPGYRAAVINHFAGLIEDLKPHPLE